MLDGPHPSEINDELFPPNTDYVKNKVIALLEGIRAFLRELPSSSRREYNGVVNKTFR